MPFQTAVSTRLAPAVAGDFASDGPRNFFLAGPGGLIAGPNGLTVSRFAWINQSLIDFDGGPQIATNLGTGGPVTGFVHRNQQALITTYLAESGVVIPSGFMAALLTAGDIWIKNEGTTEAIYGQAAYANFSNGAATFGALLSGAAGTGSSIAAASGQTIVGSISGNVLTVTTATTTVTIGAILTGGTVVTGTQIISQLTGTAGGVGTYVVTPGEQTVASATLTQTYGTLTVTGGTPSGFAVGTVIVGTGVTVGTYITALGTGTGGAGTYIVSPTQTASANSFTASLNVATKWIAMHSALPGELVKCASQALG